MVDLNGTTINVGDRVVIVRGEHLDGFVGSVLTVRAVKEGNPKDKIPYMRKSRCRCDNAKSVEDSEAHNWTKASWLESKEVAVLR